VKVESLAAVAGETLLAAVVLAIFSKHFSVVVVLVGHVNKRDRRVGKTWKSQRASI
jgi:hypothetical protein